MADQSAQGRSGGGGDFLFQTQVDDEHYAELQNLVGQKIVLATVWEDSLADALEAREKGARRTASTESNGPTCDIDLYLEDGVYFELYSVALFPSLDDEPLPNREEIELTLHELLRDNAPQGYAILGDVAVDDDDALVLVLQRGPHPALYLGVGGWVLEEWDELPE